MARNLDKAGKLYWDSLLKAGSALDPVNPSDTRLTNYVNLCFHRLFVRYLGCRAEGNRSLLEVGCARSTWLPYFAKEFGFRVSGIDYSELGCEQAQTISGRVGVKADVRCSDFFAPPADMFGAFDVVVSFGVVEHFADTVACIEAFRGFLRPGALMVTIVPNLAGMIGWIQKRFGRSVYDIHVPLTRDELHMAHEHAGFRVLACSYFMSANWYVLVLPEWGKGLRHWIARCLQACSSRLAWLLERRGISVRPNRITSPYIVCIAEYQAGRP